MSVPIKVSVVVAVQHAQDNLPQIMAALAPSRHAGVEILVCHTDADPDVARRIVSSDNVRAITGKRASLIPHLWRDGICAARGPSVALITAHCIPNADWIDHLSAADLSHYVGVGGVIVNDPAADAKSEAIFLLRYLPYSPPQLDRNVCDIAADNAIYRRNQILEHADLLADGFWEPSFHRRFAAQGLALRLDPMLRVVHQNRYTTGQFLVQRMRHGRQYGRARALGVAPSRRWLLLAASPALGMVFLAKILTRTARWPGHRLGLVKALPWLVIFVIGWTIGEVRGYADSIGHVPPPPERSWT